jgi:hypothetical protein
MQESVIAAIVVGIKYPRYFLLAIPAVLFTVLFFLLVRWQSVGIKLCSWRLNVLAPVG